MLQDVANPLASRTPSAGHELLEPHCNYSFLLAVVRVVLVLVLFYTRKPQTLKARKPPSSKALKPETRFDALSGWMPEAHAAGVALQEDSSELQLLSEAFR